MRVRQFSWIAFWFAGLAMFAAGDEARCQIPVGRFTDVTNLGPNVNTGDSDGTPHMSADGLTLYFHSRRSGGEGGADLYQATRRTVNDPFGDVMNLGPGVNGPDGDFAPNISLDGLTLYFGSNRSGGEGASDLYQATRATINDQFGDVMSLAAINTAFGENAPDISLDGLTLYFHSNRLGGEGGRDIYMATRENSSDPFASVTNLGSGINGPTDEIGPSVSSNRLILFFSDEPGNPPFRPGGQGEEDIWVAVRTSTGEQFGDVVNLNDFSLGSNVNSPSREVFPSVSHDWPAVGSQLFFVANRPDGSGGNDIWQATWVPEPSGLVLAAVGLLSAIGYGCRRKKKHTRSLP
jgi:hypothetical protein